MVPTIRRYNPILVNRAIFLVVILGLVSTACFGHETEDEFWERVKETGTLVVGMDAAYPPFETLDGAGSVMGFDVDLGRELARRLGAEARFTNIPYDGLTDALLIGHVDVLISALAIVPQAEGRVVFSAPYFNAGDVLVVPDGSSIQEMEDLAGEALAVEYGSGGDVEARQWERRLSGLTILRYADPSGAIQAVVSGEADAALVDGIAARLAVGQDAGLRLGGQVNDTLFAVAVHPDSPVMLEEINAAIQSMFEDGTIARLVEQWFGPQE